MPKTCGWRVTPHELAWHVVGFVSDDLRLPPWRGRADPLAGHCYVVAEVLYHALGRGAWRPRSVTHEGAPHWFLRNRETGGILDPTAGQFTWPIPYVLARGRGFLTLAPSARARTLAKRAGITIGSGPRA